MDPNLVGGLTRVGMALFGVVSATIGAFAADLLGNSDTRPFTRLAWGGTLLHYSGLRVSGVASWTYEAAGVIGGLV